MNQRPPGYEPDELPTALPRDIYVPLASAKVLYYITYYIASVFLLELKIFKITPQQCIAAVLLFTVLFKIFFVPYQKRIYGPYFSA